MPGVGEAVRARLSLGQWTQTRFNPDTGQLQPLHLPGSQPRRTNACSGSLRLRGLGTRTCRGAEPVREAGRRRRCRVRILGVHMGLGPLFPGLGLDIDSQSRTEGRAAGVQKKGRPDGGAKCWS